LAAQAVAVWLVVEVKPSDGLPKRRKHWYPSARSIRSQSRIMSGLKALPLDDAIRLRWILRDIRARRFTLCPPHPDDIETLVRMGYVEMNGELPSLTPAGLEEI